MGWKRIGNHSYYYRSRREGGRVVSDYLGRGETGDLMAAIQKIDNQDRIMEWAERVDERREADDEEHAIREWFDAIETVATGAMLAAGFHKHHGQWRRKRDDRDDRRDGDDTPGDGGSQAPGENDLG